MLGLSDFESYRHLYQQPATDDQKPSLKNGVYKKESRDRWSAVQCGPLNITQMWYILSHNSCGYVHKTYVTPNQLKKILDWFMTPNPSLEVIGGSLLLEEEQPLFL